MTKISVIIPVYNTELYLKECLDSVINQTLKEIEIICINDGSTDNSSEILKEYQEKDNRIVVISQKNKGPGITRNKGIKIAKGEYIICLDSDDFYYKKDGLEKLYNRIKIDKSEILFFDIVLKYNRKKEIKIKTSRLEEYKNYSSKEIYDKYVLKESINSSNCNKLFKRNLFDYINYTPNIYFEDGELLLRLLSLNIKISKLNDYILCTRERENSITTSFRDQYIDSLEKIFKTIDNIENFNITNEDKSFYKLGLIVYVIKLYIKSRANSVNIEKRIDNLKRENIKLKLIYFFKKEFKFKAKIERLFLYISTRLYINIFKLYLGRK